MSMDNLTAETRTAISTASKTAQTLGHRQVRPEHLLIGLLAAPESTPARILMGYGLFSQIATARLAALAPAGSVAAGSSLFSDGARTAIAQANRIAAARGNVGVDVASLAHAVLTSGDTMVAQVLAAVNVSPESVAAALDAALGPTSTGPAPAGSGTDLPTAGEADPGAGDLVGAGASVPMAATTLGKALATYGEDLVVRARAGQLDAVTGRDSELERVTVILGRRSKNNPVLVGEPGVGKTAIAEALAQKIADGTVAEVLADRPVVALDLAGMLAGAKMRGDFEERLKQALAEAQAVNAIVFIDEIHSVMGAGGGGGGIDAGNILKPMLARGELCVLGATTLEEYRKHIESDAALERRFQTVLVGEPSVAATVDILTGLRPVYSDHHQVTFTAAALEAAARLSDRYISDRFLPDKAIDVLDEAGAAAGMRILRAEPDVRVLYTARTQARAAVADAAAAGDRVAATEARADLERVEAQLANHVGVDGDLAVVDAGHIADVVAAVTGVPAAVVGEGESERLLTMPERVGARVIGQPDAVDAVCRAVRRVRQGLAAGTRPTSFIFAGPTGVGKTELAKVLAEDLFGEQSAGRGAFVHLDMSEYAEKSSVSRLFGAPPGYVGFDEGGQLTEQVRRNPYSVVLLDEVEKAHPDVFDALLQILEDGRLTDGMGRTVNFANTIVILTTNLGATATARTPLGFGTASSAGDQQAAAAHKALEDHFRTEFLNRIDQVVVFRPLDRADLDLIVGNLLAPIRAQLADRGVTLEVTRAAVDVLLAAGYDPTMGARPLRRAITTLLIDPLSEALLAGTLTGGRCALVDAHGTDPAALTVAVTDAVTATDLAPETAPVAAR